MPEVAASSRGRVRGLVHEVRCRVRLRTRLRRLRQRWRHAFPARIPEWSGPRPGPAGPPPLLPLPLPPPGPVLLPPAAGHPKGRQRYGPRLPRGLLSLVPATDGVWWQVHRAAAATVLVAGRVGDPLDERQAATLARLGVVAVDDLAGTATDQATALAQLAMTGVVLHAPRLPDPTAGLLAADLVALLAAPLPGPKADPLDWEIRGVRQRRTALRRHSAGIGDGGPGDGAGESGGAGVPWPRLPTVSAVLVTKRPERVAEAVAGLVAQTYPELEIVVGLHGCELAPDLRDRLSGQPRPVRVLAIPGQHTLGEALDQATRAAGGTLVTKVDDDDRYGPEHVWDLVLARHYSGATVVGKPAEMVYLAPRDRTVRRRMDSECDTDMVAGGTILLARADLDAVGGWPPVPRSVDRALLDRVRDTGGRIYRTHGLGFIYVRHDAGHTWDEGLDYFLRDPVRTWRGLPRHEEFGTG